MSADEARLFCEAGPGVGLGHVARCLALAEALEEDGLRPVFVTGPEGQAALRWMAPDRFRAVSPSAAAHEDCEVAILDDYAADRDRMETIRRDARISVVLDDFGDRELACDIVVNAAADARRKSYPKTTESGAKFLLGPAFAPLRTAIRQRRRTVLRDRDSRGERVGALLVTAGGLDGRGLAPIFLRAILAAQQAERCRIDVAIGGQATSWPAVEALAASAHGRVRLHRDTPDIADLFCDTDCSVGPGGVSLQEKLCLGLPSLAVVVSDNQHRVVEALAARGCVVPLDARSCGSEEIFETVRQALDTLLGDAAARQAMWRRGAALIDGLGARRIVLAVRPETDNKGRAVTLRRFRMEDAEALLSWQREPGMRRFFRNPDVPDPAAHRAWCEARLADPFGVCEIVQADGHPVGLVRFERNDSPSQAAAPHTAPGEVSILVAISEQGKGTGTAALRALRRLLREDAMQAGIHSDNRVSWSSFRRAGFRVAAEDRAEAPALGCAGG